MYSIDMWCVSSVKKQSINKSFSVTIKINSLSICTCIMSADTVDCLNKDKQTNKQYLLQLHTAFLQK